jgi:hypothetical protein
MGLFSFLGLGGGTEVQQQAVNNNTTEVGVTVQNNIDVSWLQSLLTDLGAQQQQSALAQADATALSAQSTLYGAAAIAGVLQDAAQAQLQQTQDVEKKVLPLVRIVALAAAAYFISRIFKRRNKNG